MSHLTSDEQQLIQDKRKSGFPGKLGRIFDRVLDSVATLAGVIVVLIMLITSYLVFARYIFHSPPAWAVEVTEYMQFAYVLMAAGWLLQKKGHVSIDMLLSHLDQRGKRLFNVATSALGSLICLVITIYGVSMTRIYFLQNAHTAQVLNFPKFILIAFIPFGFLLLSIQFLRNSYHSVAGRVEPGKKELTGL